MEGTRSRSRNVTGSGGTALAIVLDGVAPAAILRTGYAAFPKEYAIHSILSSLLLSFLLLVLFPMLRACLRTYAQVQLRGKQCQS